MIEFFIIVYAVTLFAGICTGICGIYFDKLDTWGDLVLVVVWSAIPVLGTVIMGMLLVTCVEEAQFWDKPVKKARK